MFLKSGEAAPVSGEYVEVGHGGGKVKRAQQIYVKQGDILPKLSSYTIKIEHKGSSEIRNRQHHWKLIKR